MTELQSTFIGDSAAAPPAHIVEGLDEATARRRVAGAPHTVYEELWHAAFWQQLPLDWIGGLEAAFPAHNDQTFPSTPEQTLERWSALCDRFLTGAQHLATLAGAQDELDREVRCTDRPACPSGSSLSAICWKARQRIISTTLAGLFYCGNFCIPGRRPPAEAPGEQRRRGQAL